MDKHTIEKIVTGTKSGENNADDLSRSSRDYEAVINKIDAQYAEIKTAKKCRDKCVENFNKSAEDDYAYRKFYICYYGYCDDKFPPLSSYTLRNIQIYKDHFKTKGDCLRQCQKKYEAWMKVPCPAADRVRTGNYDPPCTYKALQDKNRCLFFCDKAFME